MLEMLRNLSENPLFFFILLILNIVLSAAAFIPQLSDAVGMTFKELSARQAEVGGDTRSARRRFDRFLSQSAQDPGKYRRVRNLFLLSMVPGQACLIASVLLLRTPGSLLLIAAVSMPVYLALLAAAAVIVNVKYKRKNADKLAAEKEREKTEKEEHAQKLASAGDFPFVIILSGFFQYLLLMSVVGIVGIGFLIFGLIGDLWILLIVGGFSVLFWIVKAYTGTKQVLKGYASQISRRECEEIIDSVLHSGENGFFSYYDKVITAMDKLVGTEPSPEELWDEAVESGGIPDDGDPDNED